MILGSPKIAGQGPCKLQDKDRFKHLFCIGATGTGKTSFFLNLIVNDPDQGIIVLDPEGNLSLQVASLAGDRLVYVDKNNPISLNPLRRNLDKTRLGNELFDVVNSTVTALNPRQAEITVLMRTILRNATRVIPREKLEVQTLSDFLMYEGDREPYRHDKYWREFDRKNRAGYYVNREQVESAKRISARLALMYEDEVVKSFMEGENQFDIHDIAKNKKIVVFNLGGVEPEPKALLGNFVTHQLKSYYDHIFSETHPLHIYVDEWHRFVNRAFQDILVEARKYQISFNFSGHNLSQVSKELTDIVLSNTHTKVIFQCGFNDMERLFQELGLKPQDIHGLKPFEAIVGLGKKYYHIRTYKPPQVEPYEPPQPRTFLRDSWIYATM